LAKNPVFPGFPPRFSRRKITGKLGRHPPPRKKGQKKEKPFLKKRKFPPKKKGPNKKTGENPEKKKKKKTPPKKQTFCFLGFPFPVSPRRAGFPPLGKEKKAG